MSPDSLTHSTLPETRQRLEAIATLAERAESLAEKTSNRMYVAQQNGESINESALLVAAGRLAECGRFITQEAIALAADVGAEDVPAD